ncbi:hypothetical protein, variant 2 [Aphanomyces invadans]|uniref:HD/PDEase domain-containing protein n=1 Tax=Aphanomyces invadans TaxID=157072 RepID=A0A024U3P0_9STRA|nr:hypothetical protein, variant 2 [Aphanomyces invadans]ETW00859.1 hypothetical protein, variant 2 [Aphanomyces invadans]|eukprot:XP_008870994.1 hypothetical protein, variant 2 [Aphanomyces invadans]
MSSCSTVGGEWTAKLGPRMETNDAVIQNTVEYVRGMLASNDASHDWNHIERVWRMSVRIAEEEQVERTDCVVLAALLHDIDDWKYTGLDSTDRARAFLQTQGIGFKEELGSEKIEMFPELACVQDADRLDAIGAIGVARCLTYGGHKKRGLYDPAIPPLSDMNKDAYMANKGGLTLNHFYEKLFKLKDMMKTRAGRRIAESRHAYMVEYVERIQAEIAGWA